MIDAIKRYFTGEEEIEPDIYVYVRKGKTGVETFYNENARDLSKPIKKQLVEFLEGVKEELKK